MPNLPKELTTVTAFSKTLALALVVVLPFLGFYVGIQYRDFNTKTNEISHITNGNELSFTGIVKNIDKSCNFDGICKILVEDKWVIWELGGDPSPEMTKERGPKGVLFNTYKSAEWVGKTVKVYAKIVDENTLTIYGSKDYYIKFL